MMLARFLRRGAISLIGALAVVITAASVGGSAPGDLDTTFDSDGKVTTHFVHDEGARGVAVQPDGKIVAAGYAICTPCVPPFTPHDFALARYNQDGSLDTSFGQGGKVVAGFGAPQDEAFAVALQPDGKIVAAGVAERTNDPASGDFALARFLSNGSLDPTFDVDGMVTTDFVGNADAARAVAIQPDGMIVAAGIATVLGTHDFALARYTSAGALDPTFGAGGKVTTDFDMDLDEARGLAIQQDGKLVAAGMAWITGQGDGPSTDRFALARYGTDGSLDPGFGAGGKVTTDFTSGAAEANGVDLQEDGKIVAAGWVTLGGHAFALARYASDGSLDPSFDGDGRVVTTISTGSEARGVAIQRDGKIVAAGVACVDCLPGSDFGLARYRVDGTLDPTFSGDGTVMTDFGFADDQAFAVALQPDGKIVAAGVAGQDFALARYKVCRVSSRRSSIPCR
jgi:uncharacterized delta-60 repeat protein